MDTGPAECILLVDDDEPDRHASARVLRQIGYQVRETARAEDAFASLCRACPDLLILDTQLPGAGSHHLLQQVKQDPALAHLPIIYLSATHTEEDDVVAGLEEGADAYLTKPTRPKMLLATVRSVLRVSRLQRELARAREQAERRAQDFESLFHALRTPALLYDQSGQIVRANLAAAEAWGFDPVTTSSTQAATTLQFRYLDGTPVPPEELPSQRALQGQRVRDERYAYTDAHGQTHIVLHSVSPVREAAAIRGAVAAWQDITEIELAADRLGEANEGLEASQAELEASQAQMEEQRNLLETILETLPVAVIIAQDPECRVITTNRAARDLFGPRRNVSASAPLSERPGHRYLFHGRVLAAHELPMQVAVFENRAVSEVQLEAELEDGRRRLLLMSATPLHGLHGDVTGGVAVATDITARVQMEAALEAAAAKYAAILETMWSGYCLCDLQGRLLEVNEAYCRMSGYTRTEILRLSVADLEAAERPEDVRHHLQLIREQGHHRFESRHRRKDGRVYDVEVRASHLDLDGGRIVIFVWDISDRKQAEQERERLLRELDRQAGLLSTILRNVPVQAAYLDRDLRFVALNEAFAEAASLTPVELVGQSYAAIFPEHDDLVQSLRWVVQHGVKMDLRELARSDRRRPGGTRCWDVVLNPILGSGGRTEGVVVFVDDVTDHIVQREQLVAEQRARAELAEGLNNEIAHRVKNNLAMISGLLQMQALGQRNREVSAALRDAVSRVRTFASLHEQMYRAQSDQVDLLSVLERIAGSTREVFAGRRDVSFSVAGAPVICTSRTATNFAVITNELLTNALKHGLAADGGQRIEVELRPKETGLRLSVWSSGNPVPTDFDASAQQGMGLRLVWDLVVDQYQGQFVMRPERNGTLAEVLVAGEMLV